MPHGRRSAGWTSRRTTTGTTASRTAMTGRLQPGRRRPADGRRGHGRAGGGADARGPTRGEEELFGVDFGAGGNPILHDLIGSGTGTVYVDGKAFDVDWHDRIPARRRDGPMPDRTSRWCCRRARSGGRSCRYSRRSPRARSTEARQSTAATARRTRPRRVDRTRPGVENRAGWHPRVAPVVAERHGLDLDAVRGEHVLRPIEARGRRLAGGMVDTDRGGPASRRTSSTIGAASQPVGVGLPHSSATTRSGFPSRSHPIGGGADAGREIPSPGPKARRSAR